MSEHDGTGWDEGFEGHSLAQRQRMARMTLTEKLDWLEEAHRFVLAMQAKAKLESSDESSRAPEDD